MKKFYTLKLFLTVLFAAVFGTASADVSSVFTDKNLTVGAGELPWTSSVAAQQMDSPAADAKYEPRGVQFGTSSKPVGVFTLTSGQSLTQVTSVAITASASGAGNTISVTVGGVEFTGDVTEIASGTNNANQVYTFTGSATDGDIVITIDDNTKAVFVKSIAVACTETTIEGGGDTPEPPVEEGVLLSESFATGAGSFTIDNVTMPEELSYVWNNDDRYSCMKASAFVNSTNYAAESWLISPEIDMTGVASATLTFEQACNFFKGAPTDAVSVQVREQGGEWTKLDVTGWPTVDGWDFGNASADLSAYAGKTIQIAFVYTSTTEVAGTWEVRNVVVAEGEGGDTPEPPVSDDVTFFTENFSNSQGGFTIDDVTMPEGGNYIWSYASDYGYMKANCYINGQEQASESWLISPEINLTKATEAKLVVDQAANYFDGDASDALSIQVREQGGEWTKLTPDAMPTGKDWEWVTSTMDLSAYVGKTIQVAFVYTSQEGDAGTWEISEVTVSGKGETVDTPEPPVEEGVLLSESFATGAGSFTIDNVTMPEELSYVWNNDDRYSCMKASAFKDNTNYAAESWLISPEIDMTGVASATLTFEQACNFFKGTLADAVSVQVREQGGEWTKLDVTGWPEADGWTFGNASADLSAYAGKTIQIAFAYTSTAEVAGTWEVRNVVVRGEEGTTPEPPVTGDVVFDFNANAWGLPVSDSDNQEAGNITAPITQDGVTLTAEGGTTNPRLYLDFKSQKPQFRVYRGATVTLTAPEGKKFVGIVWNDGSNKFSATVDNGTWDDTAYTWTGSATTVTFSIAGTSNTNSIVIDLDNTDGINGVTTEANEAPVNVYSIDGRLLRSGVVRSQAADNLPAGIYIIGGQKVMVK